MPVLVAVAVALDEPAAAASGAAALAQMATSPQGWPQTPYTHV